jgi:hypothetical protein
VGRGGAAGALRGRPGRRGDCRHGGARRLLPRRLRRLRGLRRLQHRPGRLSRPGPPARVPDAGSRPPPPHGPPGWGPAARLAVECGGGGGGPARPADGRRWRVLPAWASRADTRGCKERAGREEGGVLADAGSRRARPATGPSEVRAPRGMLRPELAINLNPNYPSPGTRMPARQGTVPGRGRSTAGIFLPNRCGLPERTLYTGPRDYILRLLFVMGDFLCGEQSRGSHCCAHSEVGSDTAEDQMSPHLVGVNLVMSFCRSERTRDRAAARARDV